MHVIYAGQYYFDFEVLQRINKDVEALTMTLVYMYRDLLMSKERMEQFYRGEISRKVNHLTPTGGDRYQNSIDDDLDSFFEDIQHGRNPLPMDWTYSLSKLTEEELELVEMKDRVYFQTFRWLDDADVNENEMLLSESDAKFVSAYCRRKTISIKSERRRGRRKFIWKDKEEEIQYGSPDYTIGLIKSQQPFYPLLGNASSAVWVRYGHK